MRILIVSAAFPPEPIVSAQTTAQIAEEAAGRGHDVTVVVPFPNRPAGKIYSGYRRRVLHRNSDEKGFEIVRCVSIISPDSTMIGRFLENISFGIVGGLFSMFSPRPDVIYSNTWPIFATGILSLVAAIRRIPIVISVQDVYPESLISQGRIQPGSLLENLLRWMDGVIARGSRAVVAISEGIAGYYRASRRVSAERVHVIPNWVDFEGVEGAVNDGGFRRKVNISESAFVIAYGGNIGVAAGVETLVHAVCSLIDLEHLRLVIAGEGSQLERCRELAAETLRDRVVFYCPWPKAQSFYVLQAADVLILPTRGDQSQFSVPSKLIAYMLASRPVIALALPDSDLAEMVGRAGCGWVVEPDNSRELAMKIREIMELKPEELAIQGKMGRAFALEHLTSEACLPRVVNVIEQACQ
jgi:glycosyltransferase involved in cell wall biosynthesis